MARYQVILAYDGTEFHGFQRQGDTRTVQLEVENALRRMGWLGRSILAAGRTDTGVHAAGQVISFDLDWHHPVETLARALNAFLPPDVGVCDVREAPDDFHPRFDALWRSYRYHIYFHPYKNPMQDRFSWRIWPQVDADLLPQLAEIFLGEHDFRSFGGPMKPGGNTIRTVSCSRWTIEPGEWVFEVKANAFLYHMVRRLVFAQVQAASGKISCDELRECLQTGAALPPGMAPAQGLVLQAVGYPDTVAKTNWLHGAA